MEGLCLIRRKHVLHAGCGGEKLPPWLVAERETRLDINPACQPDIVGSMADPLTVSGVDTVFCSHALEHLHRNDAKRALWNFYSLLDPDGVLLVFVPDLEDVKPTDEIVGISEAGPVTGLDLIYGMTKYSEQSSAMMHRTGFIADTLRAEMEAAGFGTVKVSRVGSYNLFGVGLK